MRRYRPPNKNFSLNGTRWVKPFFENGAFISPNMMLTRAGNMTTDVEYVKVSLSPVTVDKYSSLNLQYINPLHLLLIDAVNYKAHPYANGSKE